MSHPSRCLVPMSSLLLTFGALGCGPDEHPAGPSARAGGTTGSAITWTVRDLGTLGGTSSRANGINGAGAIVGISGVAGSAPPRAFVWRNGVMSDLGAPSGGWSEATAINDDGVIVGFMTLRTGESRAVRWKNGVRRNLGTLGGRNSVATAINESGVIVGWSELANGHTHAFIWRNGVMTDLGTLGGTSSRATGINRSNTVVGASTTASGERHAFRWKDGVFKDLGTMGRQHSYATAINTKGQIVGAIGPYPDAAGEELDFSDGFLYYQEVMTRLRGVAQRVTVSPRAISPIGMVVGQGFDTGDEPREETAWYLMGTEGGVLPTLDPTIELDNHAGALGVNRAGTIVGFSRTTTGTRAVMWTQQ